jgi:hypothetical protein
MNQLGHLLGTPTSQKLVGGGMSQAATGMKREHNWGLEERISAKEMKTEMY